jgi:hypothetical protein
MSFIYFRFCKSLLREFNFKKHLNVLIFDMKVEWSIVFMAYMLKIASRGYCYVYSIFLSKSNSSTFGCKMALPFSSALSVRGLK